MGDEAGKSARCSVLSVQEDRLEPCKLTNEMECEKVVSAYCFVQTSRSIGLLASQITPCKFACEM
jgi:hypothetical protein